MDGGSLSARRCHKRRQSARLTPPAHPLTVSGNATQPATPMPYQLHNGRHHILHLDGEVRKVNPSGDPHNAMVWWRQRYLEMMIRQAFPCLVVARWLSEGTWATLPILAVDGNGSRFETHTIGAEYKYRLGNGMAAVGAIADAVHDTQVERTAVHDMCRMYGVSLHALDNALCWEGIDSPTLRRDRPRDEGCYGEVVP
jgi:hypothetical protein